MHLCTGTRDGESTRVDVRLRVGEAVDGLRVDKEGVPVEWLEGRVVAQDRDGAAP